MNAQAELPKYKCHKQVWALEILEITDPAESGSESDGSRLLVPAESGYAPVRVDGDWVRKHAPAVGGYYVVYQDGYTSFSPADAFKSGYTKIE